MINFITNLDAQIIFFINENLNLLWVNYIMAFITFLGENGAIWIIIGVAFLFSKKYRLVGISIGISLFLFFIFGELLLKNLIDRPRPFETYPQLNIFVDLPTSPSFPSGHASSSMAAATVIWKLCGKKIAIPALILAILISVSRVLLCVHYPSDVIFGMMFGVLLGFIAIKIGVFINAKFLVNLQGKHIKK